MGFLRDKYTTEYYTGVANDGTRLDYGALGSDEWRNGGIFHEIRDAINLAPTKDRDVLEVGFGRGESARYLLTKAGAKSYVGVDFSKAAFDLATATLTDLTGPQCELVCDEALAFLRSRRFARTFDVVYMLDTIEHIPASETGEIVSLLYTALRPAGYLVIDTPFYPVDEDFIAQGHTYVAPSASDLHTATRGMHCNKFTRDRLHREVCAAGFTAVGDKLFRTPGKSLFGKLRRWLTSTAGTRKCQLPHGEA